MSHVTPSFVKHGRLGAKLKELMLQNGNDFEAVETELTRFKLNTFAKKKAGQWVTKIYLQNVLHWSKWGSYFLAHVYSYKNGNLG